MSVLILLTGGGIAPTPAPATPPTSGLDTLRQVADFTFHNRTTVTLTTLTTYRSTHTVRATGKDLRVAFPESTGADPYTIAGASIELPGGVLHRLLFAGVASKTVADQSGPVISDVLAGVQVTAGDVIRVRVAYNAGAVPTTMCALTAEDVSAGDLTGSGTMTANSGIVRNQPAPVAIQGLAAAATVAVAGIGDSIMESKNDGGDPTKGGFFRRALIAAGKPWTNYGVNANTHASSYAERGVRYGTTLSGFTHALVEYGINDLNNAATVATVQADAIQHWNYISGQGPKVWQTTTTPYSTTTDSYATTANQTPAASNGRRVAWNDWIRDGAPIINGAAAATGTTDPSAIRAGATSHPLKGFIEVADTVESARNSGVYAANGTANWLTDDGIHPSTAGHIRMQAPVETWAAGLTA